MSVSGRSRFSMISSCLDNICMRCESIVFAKQPAHCSLMVSSATDFTSFLAGSSLCHFFVTCWILSQSCHLFFLFCQLACPGGIRWVGDTWYTHRERPTTTSSSSHDGDPFPIPYTQDLQSLSSFTLCTICFKNIQVHVPLHLYQWPTLAFQRNYKSQ